MNIVEVERRFGRLGSHIGFIPGLDVFKQPVEELLRGT
jgi:hypothetical protein